MSAIIKVEHVSKQYRLGQVGSSSLKHDLVRWWDGIRGKEDRFLKIGETNDRSRKGNSDYVWALQEISFDVQPGEVLGIIGRNGAGKSTLLKILSRVTEPTTGRIEMHGRVASLLEVGTGMHPDLTGRENIYLNGAILGMNRKEIDRKLDEIIDFAGVERYIDTPVKRYSSGMHVRLGFAVAAHLEPEILIVDEVLAVGDAEFQKKCLGKMKDVSTTEGRTVLFVSHNLIAVDNLCTRTIVLDQGKIFFNGPTDLAISKYLTDRATGFTIDENLRFGTGDLKIVSIHLEDQNGHIIDAAVSGSVLNVILTYRKFTTGSIRKLHPGITIRDIYEKPIFTHHSKLNSTFFDPKATAGKFIFTIDKLNLASGNYFLSYSVMSDSSYVDSSDQLFTINVQGGNFFMNGEILPQTLGNVLIDGHWIEQND